MCGIVRRVEAKHEHLKRYFYNITGVSEDAVIDVSGATKYVQAIRKTDGELTMREQDIALAAYLAGRLGGAACTSSDLKAREI